MEGGPPADRPHLGLLAKLLLGHAGVPRTAAGDRTRSGQPGGRHRSIDSAPRHAEANRTGLHVTVSVRGRLTVTAQYPAGSGVGVRRPVSTPFCEKPVEAAVKGGVIGDSISPAAPEHADPATAQSADRV